MAATRRDITTNQVDADRFVEATLALKAEASGLRASDLGIGPGPLVADRDLSTWDLFIVWHVWAMQQISADGRRNAAHMGPVFLPWHRWYLLVLEAQMRRVLGVGPDDFGLPYWDWAADGTNLTPSRQRTAAAVWSVVGGNGRSSDRQVISGPFTAGQFDVRIEQAPGGQLRATNRGLRRNFGAAASRLPRQTEVDAASRRRHLRPNRAGTRRRTRSATASKGGFRSDRRCTTGSTCGSAATWARAPHRTTRCSSSTTASSTSCGTRGSRRPAGHTYAPAGQSVTGRPAVPSPPRRPRLLDPHPQPTADRRPPGRQLVLRVRVSGQRD